MRRAGICFAIIAATCCTSVWACSPPPRTLEAGFVRHDVGHLPANARGVMFAAAQGRPGADDFTLTADSNPHPLRVRVDALAGEGWARIEPVDGFRPGVQYHFAYRAGHPYWRHPDRMDVVIDAARVDLAGDYAIERPAAPYQRVVTIPGGTACVTATPVVAQDFTYRIPPALAAYRKALDYRAVVRMIPAPSPRKRADWLWPGGMPQPYVGGAAGLDHLAIDDLTAVDNAVVAPCGLPRTRFVLRGRVGFPEVDRRYADTPPSTFEIDAASPGRCGRLSALVQTMQRKGALTTLRDVCRFDPVTADRPGAPYGPVSADEKVKAFESSLFPLEDMNAHCVLASLGVAWHDGYLDTRPATMARLGDVVGKMAGWMPPPENGEVAAWIAYVVAQLPAATRTTTARQFLAPMQATLAQLLALPAPSEPAPAARLLAASGKLAPGVVETLRRIAVRRTTAGRLARDLLAAQR